MNVGAPSCTCRFRCCLPPLNSRPLAVLPPWGRASCICPQQAGPEEEPLGERGIGPWHCGLLLRGAGVDPLKFRGSLGGSCLLARGQDCVFIALPVPVFDPCRQASCVCAVGFFREAEPIGCACVVGGGAHVTEAGLCHDLPCVCCRTRRADGATQGAVLEGGSGVRSGRPLNPTKSAHCPWGRRNWLS